MMDQFQAVLQRALEVFTVQSEWIGFYREIFGLEGIVREYFPTLEERKLFEASSEYDEIQYMMAELRERNGNAKMQEPTRMITVRLPKSMHESLKKEAYEHSTTLNKLCISKLIQLIDQALVPTEIKAGETETTEASDEVEQVG